MAIKNILKSLRMTKDVLRVYGDGDLIVSRYTNTSFQFDRDDSNLN